MTDQSQPNIEHTLIPWRIDPIEKDVIMSSGTEVARCVCRGYKEHGRSPLETLANAAFIVEAVNSHATLLSRAEQDAKRIEDLEAALRCISTPADVSKMKARIEDLVSALEDARSFMVEMRARHGDSGVGILIKAADRALQRGGA